MKNHNNEFEAKYEKLQNILRQIEDGNMSLDESILLYEKGMKLSVECVKILDDAKQKIEIIKNENYAEVEFSEIQSMES